MNRTTSVRLFSNTGKASTNTFARELPDVHQFETQLKRNLEDFSQWIGHFQSANLHFDPSWGDQIMESQMLALIDIVRGFQKSGNRLAGSKVRSLSAILRADKKLMPHLRNARRAVKDKASHPLSDAELYYLTNNIDLESAKGFEPYSDILFTQTMQEMEDHYHLVISQRRTSTALKLVSCFAIPLLMLWNR